MRNDGTVRRTDFLRGLRLICGNGHAEEQEMYLKESDKGDPFYACPKYYPENRGCGEPACMNHISVTEVERMADALADKFEEEEEDGGMFFARNYRFQTRVATYRVLEFTDTCKKIQVLNKSDEAK